MKQWVQELGTQKRTLISRINRKIKEKNRQRGGKELGGEGDLVPVLEGERGLRKK